MQVERIAGKGILRQRDVKIPGILVDCIVIVEKKENHMQTFDVDYDPAFAEEFRVPVSSIKPKLMDQRIFETDVMGLKQDLLSIPIKNRLMYNQDQNIFYVNFENLTIKLQDDIQGIKDQVASTLRPLGKKVKVIVNYENFDISNELIDNYMDMVKLITDEFYLEVHRYTTSTFMRMKMGESLKERSMSPHMYETLTEASASLK